MIRAEIERIAQEAGASAVAVALHDWGTEMRWSLRGERPFHAASTMKVAVLLALADAVDAGRYDWNDRLHVRNRFRSAHDGSPFRVGSGRDSNADVYARIGGTMRLRALAEHMIQTSSNLATNLLLDLLGVEAVRATVERLEAEGAEVVRGVEDERAFDAGINNTVTAAGLLALFRAVETPDAFSGATREVVREVLMGQQFRSGIPAGIPEAVRAEARFAHKTGSISTVQHDGGLVYLPDRPPYALVVLTEWASDQTSGRRETVAKISGVVYHHLIEGEEVPATR